MTSQYTTTSVFLSSYWEADVVLIDSPIIDHTPQVFSSKLTSSQYTTSIYNTE